MNILMIYSILLYSIHPVSLSLFLPATHTAGDNLIQHSNRVKEVKSLCICNINVFMCVPMCVCVHVHLDEYVFITVFVCKLLHSIHCTIHGANMHGYIDKLLQK